MKSTVVNANENALNSAKLEGCWATPKGMRGQNDANERFPTEGLSSLSIAHLSVWRFRRRGIRSAIVTNDDD